MNHVIDAEAPTVWDGRNDQEPKKGHKLTWDNHPSFVQDNFTPSEPRAESKQTGRSNSHSLEESDDYADALFGGGGMMGGRAPGGANGMFVDAAAMKEKLRQNMCKPEYNVANFYHKTGIFRYIATHKVFEGCTLGVIALNALWISIDTDHNKAEVLLGASPIFQIMEHFFCTYFTFEWFCRYMAFLKKRSGLKDGWFVFDSGMVIMMVLETWVMTIIMLASGSGGGGGLGNASILRLARLLRLSRMARMARLLRAMPELMILVKGMVAAMRSVFFTLALLIILIYIFGIMFTQLLVEAKNTTIGETHFRTVPLSMHTLLIDGTLLDGIGTVVRELGYESIAFSAIFYIFVLLAALTVMNMLIGVLCEVVSAVAATEKEEITVAFVKDKLQEVMQHSGLDEDDDGEISKDEFVKILQYPDACRCLQEVGIDVVGLVDLTDFLFEGEEGEDGEGGGEQNLTFADFMEVVLQLRGTNTATVKDIVDLRKFVRKETRSLEEKLERALSTGSLRKTGMARGRASVFGSNASNGNGHLPHPPPSIEDPMQRVSSQRRSVDMPLPTRQMSGNTSPWNSEAPSTKLGPSFSFDSNPSHGIECRNKADLHERLCTQAGKLQGMVAAGHMELLKLLESIQEYKSGCEGQQAKFPGSLDHDDTKSVLWVSEGGHSHCNGSSSPSPSPAKKQADLEELHTQMTRLQEALGIGLASLSVARDRMAKAPSLSIN